MTSYRHSIDQREGERGLGSEGEPDEEDPVLSGCRVHGIREPDVVPGGGVRWRIEKPAEVV